MSYHTIVRLEELGLDHIEVDRNRRNHPHHCLEHDIGSSSCSCLIVRLDLSGGEHIVVERDLIKSTSSVTTSVEDTPVNQDNITSPTGIDRSVEIDRRSTGIAGHHDMLPSTREIDPIFKGSCLEG